MDHVIFVDERFLRQIVQREIVSKMLVYVLLDKNNFLGGGFVFFGLGKGQIVGAQNGDQQTAQTMIGHQLVIGGL